MHEVGGQTVEEQQDPADGCMIKMKNSVSHTK